MWCMGVCGGVWVIENEGCVLGCVWLGELRVVVGSAQALLLSSSLVLEALESKTARMAAAR